MRIIADIFEFTSSFMPSSTPAPISATTCRAGATGGPEMAYTLVDGLNMSAPGSSRVLTLTPSRRVFPSSGPRARITSWKWPKCAPPACCGPNSSTDHLKNPESLALRTHSQTGWSLTEQDPFNNVTRTCIEALAAACGHTQSLHTNSLDEAIALPTDFSARIARNTQLHLQDETTICKVIDPWGGSYYVEYLTNELIRKGWAHLQEVEKLGGMAKAIETGLPKMRIEEAAARRQAAIDSGKEPIIGVNKYRLEQEAQIDILEVDNTTVREAQIARLQKLRAERDSAACEAALEALSECARTGEGNLLDLAIKAAQGPRLPG